MMMLITIKKKSKLYLKLWKLKMNTLQAVQDLDFPKNYNRDLRAKGKKKGWFRRASILYLMRAKHLFIRKRSRKVILEEQQILTFHEWNFKEMHLQGFIHSMEVDRSLSEQWLIEQALSIDTLKLSDPRSLRIYSRTKEMKSVKVVNDENLYYGSL